MVDSTLSKNNGDAGRSGDAVHLAVPGGAASAPPLPSSFIVCEAWIKAETSRYELSDVHATLFDDGRIEFDRPVFDPEWAREEAEEAFLAKDDAIMACDTCAKLFDTDDAPGAICEMSGRATCEPCRDKEMAPHLPMRRAKKGGAS